MSAAFFCAPSYAMDDSCRKTSMKDKKKRNQDCLASEQRQLLEKKVMLANDQWRKENVWKVIVTSGALRLAQEWDEEKSSAIKISGSKL